MSVEQPISIHFGPDLLISPKGESHPQLENKNFFLAYWKVSGDVIKQREFQQRLSNLPQSISDEPDINTAYNNDLDQWTSCVFNESMVSFKFL